METSAVLGAGGGIGNAVVWELSRRGLRARAVSRKGDARVPDDVEVCAADLATPEGAARACADAAVVYHCVQPRYTRWEKEFPALNDTIVAAVQRAGAKLVVADNLYMYGPITGPISETTQQEPRSRKGRLRKQLAESRLAAAETAGLRVTIGRASDYFGPEGAHSVAGRMVTNALAGKTVRWPANADFPHTFSYLPDVARGLVVLGERDEANGEVWALPAAPPITARAFVALIGQACGQPVKLSVTSKLAMRVAGLAIPDARDLPDIWYQFAAPLRGRRLHVRQSLRALAGHIALPGCPRHDRLVQPQQAPGRVSAERHHWGDLTECSLDPRSIRSPSAIEAPVRRAVPP